MVDPTNFISNNDRSTYDKIYDGDYHNNTGDICTNLGEGEVGTNLGDMGSQEIENNELTRKRRRTKEQSKNEKGHLCEVCGKIYLSRPALGTHIKNKHNDRLAEYIGARGRPKKGREIENVITKSLKPPKFEHFFNREDWKKLDKEKIDYKEILKNSLFSLYSDYPKIFNIEEDHSIQTIKVKVNEYPLLNLKNDIKTSFDYAIVDYLKEVESKINMDKMGFVCQFVIVFRESFNRVKYNENRIVNYSETNSADEVPDKCNEFICEFMEPNHYFSLNNNDVIDLIQQFCSWLYEKNYTSSVLSLA